MRVLIVDDHPVARRGLHMVVSAAYGDVDCADAADATAALTQAASLRPDLVLLDMHMPGTVAASTLCAQLREIVPAAPIVIVTAFDSIAEIRDCLLAGAAGCLLKDTAEIDMAAALRAVMAGGPALDSRIAYRLARDLVRDPAGESALAATPQLSRREKDVLELLAEGSSNRAIAIRLKLSEATVKGHVSRLLDKLNATSRLEAVMHASDAGMI
jgi:DNA-binding NarL/FixJ family response regulator